MVSNLGKKVMGCWLLAAVLLMVTLAACATSSSQDTKADDQASSEETKGSSQNPVGNDPKNQDSRSNNSSSNSTGLMTGDACGSYGWFSGLAPMAAFSTSTADGVEVSASRSAKSDFAEEVARFAEDSLEQVIDGDVSVECYVESKTPEVGSVYVVLGLPREQPSGVAQSVGDVMRDKGSSVQGSFSSTIDEGTFDLVSMQSIPVDPPFGAISMGALYLMTTTEGDHQAMMLASYTRDSVQIPSGGIDSTNAPGIAPTKVTEVVPTGAAGEINEEVQARLEKALGKELLVHSFFQTSAGGQNSVSVIYQVSETLDTGPTSTSFSQVVEGLDGTVSAAFSSGENATVLFEGLKAGGYTMAGSLSYAENQIIFTTTSVTK